MVPCLSRTILLGGILFSIAYAFISPPRYGSQILKPTSQILGATKAHNSSEGGVYIQPSKIRGAQRALETIAEIKNFVKKSKQKSSVGKADIVEVQELQYNFEVEGEGFKNDGEYEAVFVHMSNAEEQIAVPANFVDSTLLRALTPGPGYQFVKLLSNEAADEAEAEAEPEDLCVFELEGEGFEADTEYTVVFQHKSNPEDQVAVLAECVNPTKLAAPSPGPDYEYVDLLATS